MGITCSRNESFAYSFFFPFFFCLGSFAWGFKEKGKKFYTPFSCLARKSSAGMAEGPKSRRAGAQGRDLYI